MFRTYLAKSILAMLFIGFILLHVGCNKNPSSDSVGVDSPDLKLSGNEKDSTDKNDRAIVSDGPITIRDGEVTFGKPGFSVEDEKKIYKTLSYHRNMADSIEKRVPGGNNGSRQSRQDFQKLKKMFMLQYGLSVTDIDSILKKGDRLGWK